MRIRGRSQRWLLLLTVLALIAAACSGGGGGAAESDESEADGGGGGAEVTANELIHQLNEPEHMAPPSNVTENQGHLVLTALFSPLVQLDPETNETIWGDDAPDAVAASVESDDQQTWTITLKDGWTFHDGTPVTAQSYVDTWNEGASHPEYTGNYFFSSIEGYDDLQAAAAEAASEGGSEAPIETGEMSGLRVVDDLTFDVTLAEPFSQFPLVIYYSAFYALPESCLADIAACEDAPIGNGPFQMEGSWNHDQNIHVVRYDDYPGTQPKIDGIDFRIYSDLNTAYTDLQAGNIDVIDAIPPEQIEPAQSDPNVNFVDGESSVYTYLGFPTYLEPFDNPDIRKAISMAIDRQSIVDAIRIGDAPADAFMPPSIAGYREGACGEACTYNPEEAKRLFDEAGGYDGTLTLWFNSAGGHEEWMEAVSNQLRENLGIQDIQFESLDFAQYLPRLEELDVTGPYRLGWVMDYPSPQNFLEALMYTGASSNYTGWSNEEFDRLIDEGNVAETVEDGIELYNQAEDIAAEELPQAPLFFDQLAAAHSNRVTNVEFNKQEDVSFFTIEIVEEG